MSRTKETKLLMETWRKFLNEEDMAGTADSSEEKKRRSGESIGDFFERRAESISDPIIVWDTNEEKFHMIISGYNEEDAEMHAIDSDGADVMPYSRTGDFIGSGVEEQHDINTALANTEGIEKEDDGKASSALGSLSLKPKPAV